MAVIKPFPDVKQGDEVEMNASQSYDPRTTGNLEEDIVSWTWNIYKDSENWTVQAYDTGALPFYETPGPFFASLRTFLDSPPGVAR